MTDILTMNSSIFGSKFTKGGVSRRARIAMAKPLEIPTEAHEMTYADCENVDGGGYLWSQQAIDSLVFGIMGTLASNAMSVSAITQGLGVASTYISGICAAIPCVGWILSIGIKAYISCCAWDFAEAIVTSMIHRKGIMIEAKLKFGFIPMIGFTGVY